MISVKIKLKEMVQEEKRIYPSIYVYSYIHTHTHTHTHTQKIA